MALDINTNISSLHAQSILSASMNTNTQNQGSNLVESAISQVAQQDTTVYTQGMDNASQGVSLAQTATAGLEQTQNILQQMSTLATESASGVLSTTQLSDVQTEYNQLQSEVNNIAGTTAFNGISLLQNPNSSVAIQVGNSSSGTVNVNLLQTDTTSLGVASTDVSTVSGATAAMTPIANAINNISSDIAQVGSAELVLQNASTLDTSMANDSAAENATSTNNASVSSQTSNTLLNQAEVNILAQTNATSEYALQLLPQYQQQNSSVNAGSLINIQA